MSARKTMARTPKNHNTTVLPPPSSQRRFVSRSNESLAINIDKTHFKRNLLPSITAVDKDALYDFTYNEYLNNILLKHITEKELEKQKVTIENQLMYQLDNYLKLQESCCIYEQKIKQFENFQQLSDTLKVLEDIMDRFRAIGGNEELCKRLEEFLKLLESASNKLYLENVKPVNNQQDYDKLLDSIKICTNLIEKLLTSRNIDEIDELASNIQQLDSITDELNNKQNTMKTTIYHRVYEMFNTISDIFAKRTDENK